MSVLTSSLVPETFDLQAWQGATYRQQMTLTTISGEPLNLEGASGKMVVRKGPHVDPPLLELSTSNGGFILDAPKEGIFSLYLSASGTLQQTWNGGVYELLITDNEGHIADRGDTLALLKGAFTIKGYAP